MGRRRLQCVVSPPAPKLDRHIGLRGKTTSQSAHISADTPKAMGVLKRGHVESDGWSRQSVSRPTISQACCYCSLLPGFHGTSVRES